MNELPDHGHQNLLSRIRRNHALEHATLNVLASRQQGGSPLFGYSDPLGIWFIGAISTEELHSAAELALIRLRAGERNLAIHPNCGTNLLVTGILSGGAAWLAMLGSKKTLRSRLGRLPNVILLSTLAVSFSLPLGFKAQEKITTDGDPGGLEIIRLDAVQVGETVIHRILTQG